MAIIPLLSAHKINCALLSLVCPMYICYTAEERVSFLGVFRLLVLLVDIWPSVRALISLSCRLELIVPIMDFG